MNEGSRNQTLTATGMSTGARGGCIEIGWRDMALALAILAASLAFRIPFIYHPNEIVSDEGIYASLTIDEALRNFVFNAHPPLSEMLYSQALPREDAPWGGPISYGYGVRSFGEFPYVRMRLITALFGSLIPVLVFLIAIRFGAGRVAAALVAFFACADPLLVLFSRLMLPDVMLLCFGLSAVLLSCGPPPLPGCRTERIAGGYSVALAAGMLVGLAAAVKWSGLAFIVPVAVLVSLRHWSRVLPVAAGVIAAYSLVWSVHIAGMAGSPHLTMPFYEGIPELTEFSLSESGFADRTLESVDFHRLMHSSHYDSRVYGGLHFVNREPDTWPLSFGVLGAWASSDHAHAIVYHGNVFTWTLVVIAIVAGAFVAAYDLVRRKVSMATCMLAIALIGYTANYIPYFIFKRPLWSLYHYLPALSFGFVVTALLFQRLIPDHMKKQVSYVAAVVAVIVFAASSRLVYGY